MKKPMNVCAVDLGAESGRVSLGRFDGTCLDIEVVHRFPNRSVRLNGTLHWDVMGIFADIIQGLQEASRIANGPIASVGVDTWGVDFGILDADGALIGSPVHYRDNRTEGLIDEVTTQISKDDIFAKSGIAFWPFNTLYQLRALSLQHATSLREGKTLLFMPDLLHYWLCGEKKSERSIASTSQCLAMETDTWLNDLLGSLSIPSAIMPPVVPSGTVLGPLLPDIASLVGQENMQVITPACHDTASAVVATPLSSENAAYLSCGTWSLLGIESATPLNTPDALHAGFTNEKGACQTYRILKNIMGLWLVQQSRAAWARAGQKYEYAYLASVAEESSPFRSWIDPNDLSFYAPDNMVVAVQQFCEKSGQAVPRSVSEVMRCLLESLAFCYRSAIDQLEELKGISIPCLHVIGGGSQNKTLCQWTANALGRPVIAGPIEGTTMGNLLVQLMALGQVNNLTEMRQIVRQSCDLITYEPEDADVWQDAYLNYVKRIQQAQSITA